MSYFAAALARTEAGWTGVELDLGEVDDLEGLADLLRDLTDDGPGPALMMLDEDDEHLAVVRVDGGSASLEEPRVFLSDRRAVELSGVVAMLVPDDEVPVEADEDDDDGPRPTGEPAGDVALLEDLGTSADELLALCSEEGLLPSDVLAALCERAGCEAVLESLREA